MLIKGLTEEDFTNYKKTSMFIIFPTCSFKCDKEAGCKICQNSNLATIKAKDVDINILVEHYIKNPITHAIVCGGLEPLDSWNDLWSLVKAFRDATDDDIVIYTGYREDEIKDRLQILKAYKNIIVKFGRFQLGETPHYDSTLGIMLASDNQYAKKIS